MNNKKLRLLIYAPNYLPAIRYGGPIRSTHGLAKALVELGHDVQVVTTNVDGATTIDCPISEVLEVDGVRVAYFPISWPRRLYHSPQMVRFVREHIQDFDLAHINGCYLYPGPAIAEEFRKHGKPYVLSTRGMIERQLIFGKSLLPKLIWISLIERRCLNRAAIIHATSEKEYEGIRGTRLTNNNIEVIENGITLPEADIPSGLAAELWAGVPAGKRVAMLARIDWTKGIDLAIEAVRRVTGSHLRIAGPDQLGLQKVFEDALSVSDNDKVVRFVGPLTGKRKWAFLHGADVVLAPSIRESFGLTVAEALAANTPVICTTGVGASSLVSRLDPRCVVERNTEQLTQALNWILNDNRSRNEIGLRGSEIVRSEYNWTAKASKMYQLYQSILANPPPAPEIRP